MTKLEAENKQIKSISKRARERTKKTLFRKCTLLGIFMVIILFCLGVALFLPETLILTVPFLAAPAFLAFQGVNTILDSNVERDGFGFFVLFKMYFSQFFFGGYNLWKGFFKALLVMLVVSFAGTFVYYVVNPNFIVDVESLLINLDPEQAAEALLNYIETSETYQLYLYISAGASFLGALLMFDHSISFEGFKLYFNLMCKTPILAHDLNVIHKSLFKKIKKPLRKDYYKALWFMPFLTIIGFAGGFALVFFLLEVDAEVAIVVGLFGASLTNMFALPYYFDATLLIFTKYQQNYMEEFVALSIETLKELQKNQEISKEKEAEIKNFIEKQSEANKEDHKE